MEGKFNNSHISKMLHNITGNEKTYSEWSRSGKTREEIKFEVDLEK